MTNTRTIEIEGDRNGFNSKSAIEKFKQNVRSSSELNMEELMKKYVKNEYVLELVDEQTETTIKFLIKLKEQHSDVKVLESTNSKTQEKNTKRELLKAKIHNMRQMRTNSYYHKARTSSIVPDDILLEYKKLMQISKTPVPEPSEILANPEQYRPLITMTLNNSMMKSLPQNHPYVRYFKMVAKHIGADQALPIPTQNFLDGKMTLPNSMEQVMKMAGTEEDIKANEIKDEDTEEEQ
jgi:hypothetical protein